MNAPPRILVVDDHEPSAENLGEVLRKRGFVCFTAHGGAAAVAIALAERPDLIIMDIMMPGMDGVEACRAIRQQPGMAHVPLIFLTGSPGPAERIRTALEAGGDEYLSKPVQGEELVARVHALLRLKRLHDELAEQAVQLEVQGFLLSERNRILEAQAADQAASLQLAARIQTDLLPKAQAVIPGYDLAGRMLPAQAVGGDYYDVLAQGAKQWSFCIGDVAGKGLPAALLMANLQSTIRGQAQFQPPPAECVRRANQLLCRSMHSGKFVTLFYAFLDIRDHRLTYCNAGHNPPILLRGSADPEWLDVGGVILGIQEDAIYEEMVLHLDPGDLVFAYSDGITEAMNAAGDLYGEERLVSILARARVRPVAELIELVMNDVRAHAGRAAQSDDITIVACRRSG